MLNNSPWEKQHRPKCNLPSLLLAPLLAPPLPLLVRVLPGTATAQSDDVSDAVSWVVLVVLVVLGARWEGSELRHDTKRCLVKIWGFI